MCRVTGKMRCMGGRGVHGYGVLCVCVLGGGGGGEVDCEGYGVQL